MFCNTQNKIKYKNTAHLWMLFSACQGPRKTWRKFWKLFCRFEFWVFLAFLKLGDWSIYDGDRSVWCSPWNLFPVRLRKFISENLYGDKFISVWPRIKGNEELKFIFLDYPKIWLPILLFFLLILNVSTFIMNDYRFYTLFNWIGENTLIIVQSITPMVNW